METTKGFIEEFAFLSNMYEVQVPYQDMVFNSSEHLYQWLKVPDNASWWKDKIKNAIHGKVAKKLANNPKCPTYELTADFRLGIMWKAIDAKFNIPEMSQMLVETGNLNIVEYNSHRDRFWGVYGGIGHNHLGILLMKKRQQLTFNLFEE